MTRLRSSTCPSECPKCPIASGEGVGSWKAAHDAAASGELRGRRLLARAATAFMLPIAGALLGAMLAGPGEIRRFIGLLVGLVIASSVSVIAGRVIRGSESESGEE